MTQIKVPLGLKIHLKAKRCKTKLYVESNVLRKVDIHAKSEVEEIINYLKYLVISLVFTLSD